jgi:hypothetical protein
MSSSIFGKRANRSAAKALSLTWNSQVGQSVFNVAIVGLLLLERLDSLFRGLLVSSIDDNGVLFSKPSEPQQGTLVSNTARSSRNDNNQFRHFSFFRFVRGASPTVQQNKLKIPGMPYHSK